MSNDQDARRIDENRDAAGRIVENDFAAAETDFAQAVRILRYDLGETKAELDTTKIEIATLREELVKEASECAVAIAEIKEAARLESEGQANAHAAAMRSLEETFHVELEKRADAFAACVAHLEETARLEREAGVAIGEARGTRHAEEIRQEMEGVRARLVETELRLTEITNHAAAMEKRVMLEVQLEALLNSTSWRVSFPLRFVVGLLRRRAKARPAHALSTLELQHKITAIYASTSWRITRPLRALRHR